MLIGLNGFKQAGKDTFANHLVKHYNFERMAFADALKDGVANLLNISRAAVDDLKSDTEVPYAEVIFQYGVNQYSFSWREFLQRFGTEMGRNTWGEDFWVDRILPLTLPNTWHWRRNVVITDARFVNELQRIHYFGGWNVRILRPGLESDGHASEQEPPSQLIDITVDNNGTLAELRHRADEVLESIIQAENQVLGT